MFRTKEYRAKAVDAGEQSKRTFVPSEISELQNRERSFSALADNEKWLADNFDKTIHAPANDRIGTVLEADEEHVLRCLGAAVMMLWSTIPTKLQRELFDTAGTVGDVLDTAALRANIARFLHRNK